MLFLPSPPPPLALLGVCYCRSMHLAKSIRVFRASALHRYSLPSLPFHFFIPLSFLPHFERPLNHFAHLFKWVFMGGHLAKVVRSRRCTAVCDYGHVSPFTCARVSLSGCLSRQMLHLTFQHYRGGVVGNSTPKLTNVCTS